MIQEVFNRPEKLCVNAFFSLTTIVQHKIEVRTRLAHNNTRANLANTESGVQYEDASDQNGLKR